MKSNTKAQIYFLMKFIGVISIYYILITFFSSDILKSYIDFTAIISGFISELILGETSAINGILTCSNSSLVIAFGCDGTDQFMVFIAGLISIPSLLAYKIKGLVLGLLTLYVLNLFRIVGLLYISIHFPSNFNVFHEIVFPFVFILLSISFWVIWLKKIPQEVS